MIRSPPLRAPVLIVVAFASTASAQVLAYDDFNGPLIDGGVWSYDGDRPGVAELRVIDGGRGAPNDSFLRVVDDGGTLTMSRTQAYLGLTLERDGGTRWLRHWFREARVVQPGTVANLTISGIQIDSTIATAAEVKFWPVQNDLQLQCFTGAGGQVLPMGAFALDGGWHLVELATQNVGTDAGLCGLAVDGVIVATSYVDWSGRAYTQAILGEAWAADDFAGELDFDAFAVSIQPPPSVWSVSLQRPSTEVGQCLSFKVETHDVLGGVRAALATTRGLVTFGVGDVFTDNRCTTLGSQFTLDAGETTVELSVLPRVAGTKCLRVEGTDYRPTIECFEIVTPDAGVGVDGGASGDDAGSGDHGPYGVGCSCGSDPVAALLLLALALLRRDRVQVRAF